MKIPILRVRDKDGNVVEIPAIVGPPGPKGEPGVGMGNIQASDVTCENGKTVEEQIAELWQGDASMAQEMAQALGQTNNAVEAHTTNKQNPHGVTAAQVGAVPTYSGYITNTLAALDDYKTSGYYTWIAPAYNPFGAIEGALFVVNVEGAMYGTNPSPVQTVTQTYPYAGAGNTFRRTFYQASGGWSEWHRVLMDNGGAIVGALSIYGNAGAFSLVGTDHIYIPLYKNGVGAARGGYMRYGDANAKDRSIVNEVEGGALRLEAQGGVAIPSGLLYVGGAKVPRIYQSTAAPTAADGVEGDVWHQYV